MVAVSLYPVQRCFRPSYRRLCFGPERPLSPPPPRRLRTQYKEVEVETEPVVVAAEVPVAGPSCTRKPRSIPKPPGEVTRLSRGGYNLREAVDWSKEQFEDIQVSTNLHSDMYLTIGSRALFIT